MGWAVYESPSGHRLRWAGYGVPAYCDHPECNEKIDRGLAYICGMVNTAGADRGCRLHFCSKHLLMSPKYGQLCERCYPRQKKPFDPKPDHPEWVQHVLTDESWKQWREDNPEYRKRYKIEDGETK
jgi:hypothetical protein